MKFVARHVSFTKVDNIGIFAIASDSDNSEPEYGVILQFSDEEGEQDEELGLTGLHIETTWSALSGYGYVKFVHFDRHVLSIICQGSFDDIHAEIENSAMDNGRLEQLVSLLNEMNGLRTWPIT